MAPIPVFRSHANDQVLNLIPGSRPTGTALSVAIVFPGDQLAVPSHQRPWGDDRGNLMKDSTTDLLGLGCQAPALVVVQTESLVSELLSQNPVLLWR